MTKNCEKFHDLMLLNPKQQCNDFKLLFLLKIKKKVLALPSKTKKGGIS